jgi:hypothetical protein
MKKTSPLKYLIIPAVIIAVVFIFNGCKKNPINDESVNGLPITQQELIQMDNSINSFYDLKKNLVLHFNNRTNIQGEDIFYSDEVMRGVRYEFLMFAQMGIVKEISQDVKILNNEVSAGLNGNIIVPATVGVRAVTITETGERSESAYSEKLFFSFLEKDGQWKITKIEELDAQYGMDTKYGNDVVFPYALTLSQLQENAQTSDNSRILLEQRKIFEDFFGEKINEDNLSGQLRAFNEKNNLISNSNEQRNDGSGSSVQSQPLLNKSAMLNYVFHWSAYTPTNLNSTAPYNNAQYKPNVGYDCANFASQCLIAGGWQYANTSSQYYVANAWWYKNNGTPTNTADDYSSNAWAGADALCTYVVVNNHYANFVPSPQAHASSNAIGLADLCWHPDWGTKTHVLIVTWMHWASGYNTIELTAHTDNRVNWLPPTTYAITFGHFP